jgi:hypothetical protein
MIYLKPTLKIEYKVALIAVSRESLFYNSTLTLLIGVDDSRLPEYDFALQINSLASYL